MWNILNGCMRISQNLDRLEVKGLNLLRFVRLGVFCFVYGSTGLTDNLFHFLPLSETHRLSMRASRRVETTRNIVGIVREKKANFKRMRENKTFIKKAHIPFRTNEPYGKTR